MTETTTGAFIRRPHPAEPPLPGSSAALEDRELVAALRRGNDEAYARLVHAHGPPMLRAAHRVLRDESAARDAVQDALLSAYRGIASWRGQSRLSTWLHRITVNAAKMRRRARERVALDTVEGSAGDAGIDPHRAAERSELRDLVRRGLGELPEKHRNVLRLRDIEGLDNGAVARALGKTPAATKLLVHRARRALGDVLARRYPDLIPA